MARRKPTRSGRSRSRRRSGKGYGEWKWYLAIAVCTVIAVGVGVVSTRLISASEIDENTLCHRSGQLNTTMVLLDMTDPLNKTQHARLERLLYQEIAVSSVDTMVALGVVSEQPGRWGVLFAKCKPETGEDANALYENPTLIAERYEKEFVEPVRSTLASVVSSEPENASPIMEAMQLLISETPALEGGSGRNKLIIVSDMLQHSETLSFYRGQGWDYFVESDGDGRLAGNLSGFDVEILRIPRTGSNIPGNEIVEAFWTRYFDRQGSHPPIVRSLGDL